MKDLVAKIKVHVDKVGADKIGYIGAALMILGVFLAFVSMSARGSDSESFSLWESGDYGMARAYAFVMIASAVALAAFIYLKQPVKFAFLAVGVPVGMLVSFIIDISVMADAVGRNASVSWGIGMYVMVVGAIAGAVYCFFNEEKTA